MNTADIFARNGKFLMAAFDHRGSFAKLAETANHETLITIKQAIIEALYDDCSGLLIDQEYGLPAYHRFLNQHAIKKPKPFLSCMESSGYENEDDEKVTNLQYAAKQIRSIGALGIKLLLFFNPDARSADKQLRTAKRVQQQCKEENMPFFLEIITYPVPNTLYDKASSITRSLQCMKSADIHPDVFKLEYPGDSISCDKITQLLQPTPWILLTKGGTFERFRHDLGIAAQHGASGFLAGRSIWQDYMNPETYTTNGHMDSVVKTRFRQIVQTVIRS